MSEYGYEIMSYEEMVAARNERIAAQDLMNDEEPWVLIGLESDRMLEAAEA